MNFFLRSIANTGVFIFQFIIYKVRAIRKFFWRLWYDMLSKKTRKRTNWTFMNYGYRGLDQEQEKNFWQQWNNYDLSDIKPAFYDMARLYYEVCTSLPDKNFSQKKVLEIGSGRGGGAAFVARNFNPESVTGVDLSSKAVVYCQNKHKAVANLVFEQGDAENLLFADEEFDIALNIESSHCYGNFEKFITQTHRVLKKDGLFYFADFRTKSASIKMKDILKNAGFSVLHTREITPNVLKSLAYTSTEKKAFLEHTFPRILQRVFRTFAGVKGTYMYEKFANGEMVYFLYVLQKK